MKILLIDNYDSFTYNLYHYLSSLKCKVEVYRNDKIKIDKIKKKIYLKYNQGYKLGCYTASSKGNTLLNCLNIEKKIILINDLI